MTQDVVINGFHLEKGKTVFANIWSSVRDPSFWENADEFDPYRFIDNQGCCIQNHPAMLLFGFGQRKCVGEAKGKLELFLVFASLMQTFKFTLVKRPSNLENFAKYGVTIFPSNILFAIEKNLL